MTSTATSISASNDLCTSWRLIATITRSIAVRSPKRSAPGYPRIGWVATRRAYETTAGAKNSPRRCAARRCRKQPWRISCPPAATTAICDGSGGFSRTTCIHMARTIDRNLPEGHPPVPARSVVPCLRYGGDCRRRRSRPRALFHQAPGKRDSASRPATCVLLPRRPAIDTKTLQKLRLSCGAETVDDKMENGLRRLGGELACDIN